MGPRVAVVCCAGADESSGRLLDVMVGAGGLVALAMPVVAFAVAVTAEMDWSIITEAPFIMVGPGIGYAFSEV